jgi:peptide/nickel transport system permease protein
MTMGQESSATTRQSPLPIPALVEHAAANEGPRLMRPELRPGVPRIRGKIARQALHDPVLLTSGGLVICFVLVGLFAPIIAPYPYDQQNLVNAYQPPFSPGHLLGTDNLGRDQVSRLAFGMRTSLFVSGVVTIVSLTVGMVAGLTAGFFGGWVDRILSGVMDLAWGFPIILVAIIVVAVLGPGISSVLIGIAVVNWAGFGRIIRGATLELREREFVEAARMVGTSNARILLRHVMPNTLPPTLVMASFYMGIVITVEAALSFIGLGAQPPLPSIGQMVDDGRAYLFRDLWLVLIPGGVLAIIVLAFNQLGDSLRDLIDPRLKV